jgi:hypothetical protein
MEREAGWCGGVLLVPRPPALRFDRNPARRAALRQEYGVCEEMIDLRLKVTSAIRQVG